MMFNMLPAAFAALGNQPARRTPESAPRATRADRTKPARHGSDILVDMGIKAVLALLIARLLDVDAVVVMMLSLLVIGDFATGVWRAYKNGGAEAITSKGFRRTFEKVALYSVGILVAMAIGNIVGHSERLPETVRAVFLQAPNFAFAGVMILEGASILENLSGRPLGVLLRAFTAPMRALRRAKKDLDDIDAGK